MRFVVLHHTGWAGQPDHYDLMLQAKHGQSDDDPVLKTWATLTNNFPCDGDEGSALRLLPDHRRLYLSYEGPVAGGRGNVLRADEGSLNWLAELVDEKVSEYSFQLSGKRLCGTFRIRLRNQDIYGIEKVAE